MATITSGWSRVTASARSVWKFLSLIRPQPGNALVLTLASPVACKTACRAGSASHMTLSPMVMIRIGADGDTTRPAGRRIGGGGGLGRAVGEMILTTCPLRLVTGGTATAGTALNRTAAAVPAAATVMTPRNGHPFHWYRRTGRSTR